MQILADSQIVHNINIMKSPQNGAMELWNKVINKINNLPFSSTATVVMNIKLKSKFAVLQTVFCRTSVNCVWQQRQFPSNISVDLKSGFYRFCHYTIVTVSHVLLSTFIVIEVIQYTLYLDYTFRWIVPLLSYYRQKLTILTKCGFCIVFAFRNCLV